MMAMTMMISICVIETLEPLTAPGARPGRSDGTGDGSDFAVHAALWRRGGSREGTAAASGAGA